MRFFVVALGLSLCYLIAAVNAYTVEVYISVDDAVKKHYQKTGTPVSNIKKDILYTMTAVNDIYATLKPKGVDIDFKLSQLDILDKDIFTSAQGNKIQDQAGISDFQKYLADNGLYKSHKYDMALHFTGLDLQSNYRNIAGYALIKKVCDPQGMSTGIMTFKGIYADAIFTAHEIAHLLGVRHDTGSCLENYALSAIVWYYFRNKWTFSPCTIKEFQKHLPTHTCLTKTSPTSQSFNGQPSSEMLDGDIMCKRNGADFMCKDAKYDGDARCQAIMCSKSGQCYYHIDTTEGMSCGSNGRCKMGTCEGGDPSMRAPSCRNDAGDKKCDGWGSAECSKNQYWMGANCEKTCGKCGGGGGSRTTKPSIGGDCKDVPAYNCQSRKNDPKLCEHYFTSCCQTCQEMKGRK